jgi:hypothetical protein
MPLRHHLFRLGIDARDATDHPESDDAGIFSTAGLL